MCILLLLSYTITLLFVMHDWTQIYPKLSKENKKKIKIWYYEKNILINS